MNLIDDHFALMHWCVRYENTLLLYLPPNQEVDTKHDYQCYVLCVRYGFGDKDTEVRFGLN